MDLELLFLGLLVISSNVSSLDQRIDPLVLLDQGLVRGLRASDGDYAAFYGIPYGQVDYTNPFGNALPAPSFDDVFNANNLKSGCPQYPTEQNDAGCLDCLKLNIFAPNSATTQKLQSVLVWIHGGGYGIGKGPVEYASSIVKHDIVLVTINYRLGPYGFMCLDVPSVPGNQGLKDQFLALRWVKDNIAAFGGDPDDITIGGDGAGGNAVNFHLYARNEKLFNKAIIHSCTTQTISLFTPGDVSVAKRLAENLGYNATSTESAITFLATLSPDEVIVATRELDVQLKPCKELSFSGIENFIESDPFTLANELKIKDTPILIGLNSKELQRNTVKDQAYYIVNSFREVLAKSFDLDEDELNKAATIVSHYYVGDKPISEALERIEDFQSEFFFDHALEREVTKLITTQGAGPIYEYVFNYLNEDNKEKFRGAPHGYEMAYVFEDNSLLNKEAKLVAEKVNKLWADFIKNGNPTPDSSELQWEPVTIEDRPYLMIDSVIRMKQRFQQESMAFWDMFYASYGKFNKIGRQCTIRRQ